MSYEQQLLGFLRLLLAALLSALIGLNRERLHKSAGLRTHMLAGVGACLFTILSIQAFPAADHSRIAAGVVQGIGFLGAGVIVQRKGTTHDLTTAASIWTVAAVGMTVAVGSWLLAICTTLLVWITLEVVRRFSKDEQEQCAKAQVGN